MKKKLLSLLLTLSLVLGCMPPAALAAEPEAPDESGSVVEDAAENEAEALPPEEELPAAEGEETPAPADDEAPAADEPEQASDTEAPSDGEAELMASTTMSDVWGGVTWSLTPAGTLTISAAPGVADSGVMPDGEGPWVKCLTNGVKLYELIVREGVTHIGDYAFAIDSYEDQAVNGYLDTVTLPNSLTSIGDNAFYTDTGTARTSSLKSITLPSNLKSIGKRAFMGCTKLDGSITIPGSCTTVGEEAFKDATITGLTLSEGVETIGRYAFQGCGQLTSVTFPSSIQSVGEKAFANCGSVQTVHINSAKGATFYNRVFESCGNLTTLTIAPNSITDIPNFMFYECTALKNVSLPEGIKSIGVSSFSGCGALTEIELPNSLLTLGEYAFYRCNSLQSITIPNKVWNVQTGTFQYCFALETVVLGEQVLSIASGAFTGTSPTNITVYYNLKSVDSGTFSGSGSMNVTFYGTQAEWEKLCSRSSGNNRLTSAIPTIIPITHTTLTWDSGNSSETVNSVVEAAANQATLKLAVERPMVEGITEETLVTAMAAAYDGAGRMLGYFSCEVNSSGGVMNIQLPTNAVYIKLMMVNGDNTAPLLPAKSIT